MLGSDQLGGLAEVLRWVRGAGVSSPQSREGLRLRQARTLLFVRLALKPLDWCPYLPRLKL